MPKLTHRLAILSGIVALVVGPLAAPAPATYRGPNGSIVFAADTGEGYHLYTIRANGKGLHEISTPPGDAINPDWSPDGSTIAFELDKPTRCVIMLVNADGSDPRTLISEPNICNNDPSYTPDGSAIVYVRYDPVTNTDGIWERNLDGSGQHEITNGTGRGTADPNVAPNGQTLSFLCFNGKEFGNALCTIGMDGTGFRRLTPYSLNVSYKHDWAPDGSAIGFSEHVDQPRQFTNIVTIRPDGTGLHKLTHYRSFNVDPLLGTYSPDGKWIVYRLEDHGQSSLLRMHPDGTSVRTILPPSDFRPRFIDWGPAYG
jgi:Tol biopolymer transport system component